MFLFISGILVLWYFVFLWFFFLNSSLFFSGVPVCMMSYSCFIDAVFNIYASSMSILLKSFRPIFCFLDCFFTDLLFFFFHEWSRPFLSISTFILKAVFSVLCSTSLTFQRNITHSLCFLTEFWQWFSGWLS